MNPAFAGTLTSRLTELTQDLLFDHKPTGTTQAPEIIELGLGSKPAGYEEGQNCPYVLWVIPGGEFARMSSAPFSVSIYARIYTGGSISDGSRDINALVMALGKIVNKTWFKPYKLRNRTPFFIGSQENHSLGMQPHPYYMAELHLQFTVASGHGG